MRRILIIALVALSSSLASADSIMNSPPGAVFWNFTGAGGGGGGGGGGGCASVCLVLRII